MWSEIDDQVTEFMHEYDAKICEYIAGPPWNDFFEAPPTADPRTASFIKSLQIPQLRGKPMLILHDLTRGIVYQNIMYYMSEHNQ